MNGLLIVTEPGCKQAFSQAQQQVGMPVVGVLPLYSDPEFPSDGRALQRPAPLFFMKAKREALTAPVLLSKLQSGMIFERVTIQLLILSLLLLSTANRHRKKRQ